MKSSAIILTLCCVCLTRILLAQIPPFDWVIKFDGPHKPGIQILDLQLDKKGNLVALGSFVDSVDLDPGPGTINFFSNFENPFIMKLTPSGQIIWVKEFGISQGQIMSVIQMELDTADNIIIVGRYQYLVDFDPGVNTYTLSSNTLSTFLLKLNMTGQFQWVKELQGVTIPMNIQVDLENSIYLAGSYKNTVDFDPGPSVNLKTATNFNGFLLKTTKSGDFRWVKVLNGPNDGQLVSILNTNDHSIFYAGFAKQGTDLNPDSGILTTTTGCTFITKLDSSGGHIKTKQFVGAGRIKSLAFQSGIVMAGTYTGQFDLDPGLGQQVVNTLNAEEGFIIKTDTALTYLWSKAIVSSTATGISNMELSCSTTNSIYLLSSFSGELDFDPSSATYTLKSHPAPGNYPWYWDYALLAIDSIGNFNWAFNLGPCPINYLAGIISKSHHVYLGSSIVNEVDFDPSPGSHTISPTPNGHYAGFILRLADCSSHPISVVGIYPSQIAPCVGETVTLTAFGAQSYYWGYQYPIESVISVSVTTLTNFTAIGYFDDGCYLTSTVSISPDACLGLEVLSEEGTAIFPNPTSSNITILSNEATLIEITDSSGKKVFSQKLMDNQKQSSIQNLPCGIYILKLFNNKGIIRSQKLVKTCD